MARTGAIVLAGAVTGAFRTQAPGLTYLRGETLSFIAGNLSLTSGHYTLTGIRCGDAPCNVNGSLWTITWEARCYLLPIALLLAALSSPRTMRRLVLPATFAFAVLMHVPAVVGLLTKVGATG